MELIYCRLKLSMTIHLAKGIVILIFVGLINFLGFVFGFVYHGQQVCCTKEKPFLTFNLPFQSRCTHIHSRF